MKDKEIILILDAQQEILKELLKNLKVGKHLTDYENNYFKNLFAISKDNLEVLKSRLKS